MTPTPPPARLSDSEWNLTFLAAAEAVRRCADSGGRQVGENALAIMRDDRAAAAATEKELRALCLEAAGAIAARAGADADDDMAHDIIWRRLRAAGGAP